MVPVAASSYAHMTRPLGDAGIHEIQVGLVVTLVAPVVSIVGYLLATRRSLSLLRSIAAWLVAALGGLVFVLAARRARDERATVAKTRDGNPPRAFRARRHLCMWIAAPCQLGPTWVGPAERVRVMRVTFS